MKLLAVALYNHRGSEAEPACLGLGAELSNFGYFQRASVKEMLAFLSKTIVQRTAVGQRQTVKQEDYFCHVHVKDGGIAGVAVTDKDYPTIAAFSVVGKAIEEFLQLGDESWRTQTTDGTQALTVVEAAVTKYQVRHAQHVQEALLNDQAVSCSSNIPFPALPAWAQAEAPVRSKQCCASLAACRLPASSYHFVQ